jgi:hypothetical protein
MVQIRRWFSLNPVSSNMLEKGTCQVRRICCGLNCRQPSKNRAFSLEAPESNGSRFVSAKLEDGKIGLGQPPVSLKKSGTAAFHRHDGNWKAAPLNRKTAKIKLPLICHVGKWGKLAISTLSHLKLSESGDLSPLMLVCCMESSALLQCSGSRVRRCLESVGQWESDTQFPRKCEPIGILHELKQTTSLPIIQVIIFIIQVMLIGILCK